MLRVEMKDIRGFEDRYAVTTDGRVWSHIHNKFLKPLLKNRYHLVDLCRLDGTICQASIHRLVASTYIPNPNNYPVVNHKDENRLNNCVDNLEWCTHQYNSNYGGAKERRRANRGSMQSCWEAAANARSKPVKCLDTGIVYASSEAAGRAVGTKGKNISRCCRGERKTAHGYGWVFVDKAVMEDG